MQLHEAGSCMVTNIETMLPNSLLPFTSKQSFKMNSLWRSLFSLQQMHF